MQTTAKTDIVNYVLGLFATAVLLVAWPRGKKGSPQKWTKITAQDMADPAYLQKLAVKRSGLNGPQMRITCYFSTCCERLDVAPTELESVLPCFYKYVAPTALGWPIHMSL